MRTDSRLGARHWLRKHRVQGRVVKRDTSFSHLAERADRNVCPTRPGVGQTGMSALSTPSPGAERSARSILRVGCSLRPAEFLAEKAEARRRPVRAEGERRRLVAQAAR